jgi:hypothetical protein
MELRLLGRLRFACFLWHGFFLRVALWWMLVDMEDVIGEVGDPRARVIGGSL